MTLSDLMTGISRSRHFWSWISENQRVVRQSYYCTREKYPIYGMVLCLVTLIDLLMRRAVLSASAPILLKWSIGSLSPIIFFSLKFWLFDNGNFSSYRNEVCPKLSFPWSPSELHRALSLAGDRKDIQPVKNWMLVCRWWHSDKLCKSYSSSCYHLLNHTFSSNKIQNRFILVPANPGPPGKWPLRRRDSVCTLTILFWWKLVSDCEPVFARMGDISNVYCATIENSLRKLNIFTYQ